ncbi:WD40-repeat-containing domain protein [Myxozyma melibiosi]|uniref:WD40-repeat-containing domain protein n=1 Tax=Myxozyma melibiosi TaxID=54550 RepID=A0ABR1F242_9ASCO
MELKAEIEAKKARLADLRRLREQRVQQHSVHRDVYTSPSRTQGDRRADIDQLVADLVGSPRTPSRGVSRPASRIGDPFSDVGGVEEGFEDRNAGGFDSRELGIVTTTLFEVVPAERQAAPRTQGEVQNEQQQRIVYSKEVQTDDFWSSSDESGDEHEQLNKNEKEKREGQIDEVSLRRQIREEIERELRTSSSSSQQQQQQQPEKEVRFKISEKSEVLKTSSFLTFLESSTKVVERTLDEEYDVLYDYAVGVSADARDAESESLVRQSYQFFSEKWSKDRSVTSIDWSSYFPELVLASYSRNTSSLREPAGVVQVWNTHLQSRPEFVFQAQSDVLVAKFSPFNANLVIGGCYNGQILVWDTRSGATEAVHRSALNGSGHAHPIYSLDFANSSGSNTIVSCSTDGRVCSWTVDMLARPQELIDLKLPPPSRTEDLAPTTICVPRSDPTYFLVGSEDGNIYSYNRTTSRANLKAGLALATQPSGHFAPVSALGFHPAGGAGGGAAGDLSEFVLSASLDWTVKLWRVSKSSTGAGAGAGAGASTNVNAAAAGLSLEAVAEFAGADAIYDVAWSPVRPAVFAATGCAGKVDIWDLTVDTGVPVASASVSSSAAAAHTTDEKEEKGEKGETAPLNKIAWEKREGRQVAVGGVGGRLTVFDVGQRLSSAKAGEAGVMRRLVAERGR